MCLAIPGKITSLYERDGLPMGRVDFDGVAKEACLAYLPDARVDDYVMIHVGFAISRIDEDEAFRTLALLRDLGELQEALGEVGQDAAQ
jgi:hydrogenase expression/formation protein HypC